MTLKAELQRLRDLDWRELDVREAGTWPISLKVICHLLVLGGLFWAMNWYVAAPRAELLERARSEERELIQRYESKAYQAASLPTMRKQMGELEARMAVLLEMLPTGVEVPALIDNISDTAHDNQLTIDFIRLLEPKPQEFYTEQPFDIQVQGDYHRIAAFLSGVAGLPRIVTLHDFKLVPAEQTDTLRLSMLAKTYNHRSESQP
ncbi:type IV pilus assembly protein PilO [Modicisalibacter ilicicola DSM 19980]|uniref:Type IV pilus assembly protein PilO n=1 Tax=Modicisalibacter ilicicola DSM 19980 TaxID=1121942 RepID=A0A1M4V1E7_9GAMM|nr:type 4a pilus biogenesis protein PilO [Halomonas ilicicola]SHE62804.1 type IV pilus assembly protein PilO [Halomonas ilicicola DSM 19980]